MNNPYYFLFYKFYQWFEKRNAVFPEVFAWIFVSVMVTVNIVSIWDFFELYTYQPLAFIDGNLLLITCLFASFLNLLVFIHKERHKRILAKIKEKHVGFNDFLVLVYVLSSIVLFFSRSSLIEF